MNQGFLTLRHHIPEPFRVKKMSKVDTLRSAVEYIRSLEQVLVEAPSDEYFNTTPFDPLPFPDENESVDSLKEN